MSLDATGEGRFSEGLVYEVEIPRCCFIAFYCSLHLSCLEIA
jgi:hypothetical protein